MRLILTLLLFLPMAYAFGGSDQDSRSLRRAHVKRVPWHLAGCIDELIRFEPEKNREVFYSLLETSGPGLGEVLRRKGFVGGARYIDYLQPPMRRILSGGVYPHLNVMVIGDGAMRDTSFLTQLNTIDELHVIEVHPLYAGRLEKEFGSSTRLPKNRSPRVNIYNQSIGERGLNLYAPGQPGSTDPGEINEGHIQLSVCTFGGKLEWTDQEEPIAIENIYRLLAKGGVHMNEFPAGPITSTHNFFLYGDVGVIPASEDPRAPLLFLQPMMAVGDDIQVDFEKVIRSMRRAGFVHDPLRDVHFYEMTPPGGVSEMRVQMFFEKPGMVSPRSPMSRRSRTTSSYTRPYYSPRPKK